MSEVPESDGLGSLSQAARSKQLSSAKAILIFIGVVTILGNFVFLLLSQSAVDREIDAEVNELRGQGMEFDEEKLQEYRGQVVRATRIINGLGMAIGVGFLLLGANVKKYPVPITITGLVLYLGCWAVFGLLDPSSLLKGWIIKLFIIAGLIKAVQAALAYEKEAKVVDRDQPLAPFA